MPQPALMEIAASLSSHIGEARKAKEHVLKQLTAKLRGSAEPSPPINQRRTIRHLRPSPTFAITSSCVLEPLLAKV
jgi:hypothetical protein